MGDLVLPAEYARHRGVHKSTVHRQLEKGLLPSVDIGGRRYIDPDVADEVLRANRDPARGRHKPLPGETPGATMAPSLDMEGGLPLAGGGLPPAQPVDPALSGLAAVRLEEAQARVRKAAREEALQLGQLLIREEVELAVGTAVRNFRNRLEMIPVRMGLNAALSERLATELTDAMAAMAKSLARLDGQVPEAPPATDLPETEPVEDDDDDDDDPSR